MKTCPLILLTAAAAWSPLTLAAEAAPAAAAQAAPAASGPQADYPKALALAGPKSTDADKAEALRLLRASADSGYAPAITELGHATLHGRGTPANPAEALRLFEAAAAKGDTQGDFYSGLMRAYGLVPGAKADLAEGLRLVRRAADKNDPDALKFLVSAHTKVPSVRTEPLRASDFEKLIAGANKALSKDELALRRERRLDFLRLASERGNAHAADDLGDLLNETGKKKEAQAAYDRAASLDFGYALYRKAQKDFRAPKTPEQKAAYRKALEYAVDHGSGDAADRLDVGMSPESFRPLLDPNEAASLRARRRGIELGNPDCISRGIDALLADSASPADKTIGLRALRLSFPFRANEHVPHHILALYADRLLRGELPSADAPALVEHISSRNLNDEAIRHLLGDFYTRGFHLPKDPAKAVSCYEKNTTGYRYLASCMRLAEALSFGEGVKRDDARAEALLRDMAGTYYGKPDKASARYDLNNRLTREAAERLAGRLARSPEPAHLTLAALLLLESRFLNKDTAKAESLLRAAAAKGYVPAKFALGEWLMSPENKASRDESAAKALVLEAAQAGHPAACAQVCQAFSSFSVPAETATACVELAAKSGDAKSMELYGTRLYDGVGCTANPARAAEWLLKSQTQTGRSGGSDAEFYLTLMRLTGDGMEQDKPAALKVIKDRAPNGSQWAAALYIDALLRGDGVPADRDAALKLLEQYANGYHKTAWARLLLAEQHLVGDKRDALAAARLADSAFAPDASDLDDLQIRPDRGWVSPSAKRERAILRDAVAACVKRLRGLADNGDSTAAGIVARLLKEGVGVPADADAAKAYAAKAAEAGDPAALFTAATDLLGAEKRDAAKAAPLLKRAADAGFAPAAHRYAMMLLLGDGVPENPAEGVKYLRLATDAGERDARCRLGECLAAGIGAPKDEAEAVRLWKLNLNPAHPLSVRLLADACEHGRGIPADPAEAAGLLQYLSRNDRSVGNRAEALMDKLTPEQRRAAEKRFRELLFNRPGL